MSASIDSAAGGFSSSDPEKITSIVAATLGEETRAQFDELNILYRTAPIGLAVLDSDLRFVRVNERLAEIDGLSVSHHIGRKLVEVVPDLAGQGEEICRRVLTTGESVLNVEVEGETFATPGVKRTWNGSWHPIKNQSGKTVAINAVIEEITERRVAERQLAEDARIKGSLYRLTDRLQRAQSLEDMFDAALIAIEDALRCSRASILLYDDTGVMRFVAWRGLSDEYRAAVEGHSPWTRDAVDPMPIGMDDVEQAELSDELRETIRREGIRALAFIPLCSQGRLIGKFMTYFDAPFHFDQGSFDLCQSISRQLSFGIERQRSEQALQDSERRFRQMIDALPAAIYTTDAAGRLTHFNPAAVEFSGRVPELGSDQWCVSWKLYWPDGTPLPLNECPMAVSLKEGRVIRGAEAIAERPDGARRWFTPYPTPLFDSAGKVSGGINMLVDITDRKQIEQALEQHAKQLSLITDIAPVHIAYCDADCRFKFVNEPYAKRYGLYPDAVKGRHVADVVGQDIYAVLRPHIDAVLRGERVEFDVKVNRPPQGERFMHCWYAPERDTNQRVIGFVAAVADITERKLVEEALRASEERLKDIDRRKDEFLAMLSHELRNPLAPIANAVHLLRLETSPSPILTQARAIIERQSGRLARLVDDLLEVSRITTGRIQLQLERLAIQGVIERAIETVKPLLTQYRHTLSLSVCEQSIWVEGDGTRLEQVLVNLLTNAAKYTDEGGHIELSVATQADRILIRVKDDGIGIDKSLLPHIFELFTQSERALDRSQGGLGIGLALVQRIVSMHGGDVSVESEIGVGSTFLISLPVASEPVVEAGESDRRKNEGGATLRVLIVDDNVDAAKSLELLLQLSGHTVWIAHDGAEALNVAVQVKPDLMLLDIGLPKLDGYTVARKLRLNDIKAMLVAVTGYGQPTDRERALEAGFDDHLVKPVDYAAIEQLLAKASAALKSKP